MVALFANSGDSKQKRRFMVRNCMNLGFYENYDRRDTRNGNGILMGIYDLCTDYYP
jgi:hypothetical protein